MKHYRIIAIGILFLIISCQSFAQEKVGINTVPVTELDVRTTTVDDGADINVGNADNSHFLRMFSGKTSSSFPNPTIYWKSPDSLMFGRLDSQFLELMRLNPDGDILMKEGGIAYGTDSTDGFFEIYVDSAYTETLTDQESNNPNTTATLNSTFAFGQSFEIGITGKFFSIKAKNIKKAVNTPTFIRLNLYEGNSPGGTLIRTSVKEVVCIDFACITSSDITFGFSTVEGYEGDEYFYELVWESGADIEMAVANPGSYSNGNAWLEAGGSWTEYPNIDGVFTTYIAIPAQTKVPFMKISQSGNNGRVQIKDYFMPNHKGEHLQVMTTTASGQLIFTDKEDDDWEITSTELYTPSRNVGIGLDQPEVALHIRTVYDNNGVVGGLKIENPGVGPLPDEMMLIDGNEIDAYGAENEVLNEALHLQNNSPADIVMVNGGGNVGIGSPNDGTSKLFVSGLNGMKIANSTFGSSLHLKQNSIETSSSGSSPPLYFQSNGNVYANLNSGGIGIGTTNIPANYKLAVEGKIIAEELRVELETNWPDYVFEKSYPLMTLEKLEKVIEKQNHLPGIPSAQEIENEGQHVGEIQVKLLEKIEELTLHVIELNKRIKELESRQQ